MAFLGSLFSSMIPAIGQLVKPLVKDIPVIGNIASGLIDSFSSAPRVMQEQENNNVAKQVVENVNPTAYPSGMRPNNLVSGNSGLIEKKTIEGLADSYYNENERRASKDNKYERLSDMLGRMPKHATNNKISEKTQSILDSNKGLRDIIEKLL